MVYSIDSGLGYRDAMNLLDELEGACISAAVGAVSIIIYPTTGREKDTMTAICKKYGVEPKLSNVAEDGKKLHARLPVGLVYNWWKSPVSELHPDFRYAKHTSVILTTNPVEILGDNLHEELVYLHDSNRLIGKVVPEKDILRMFRNGDAGLLDEEEFRKFVERYHKFREELPADNNILDKMPEEKDLIRTGPEL